MDLHCNITIQTPKRLRWSTCVVCFRHHARVTSVGGSGLLLSKGGCYNGVHVLYVSDTKELRVLVDLAYSSAREDAIMEYMCCMFQTPKSYECWWIWPTPQQGRML